MQITTKLLRAGRFVALPVGWLLLLVGAGQGGTGKYVYRHDDEAGTLMIERILPDANGIVTLPSASVTVKTGYGNRDLTRDSKGDCRNVFDDLLLWNGNKERHRLIVQTKDTSYYSVLRSAGRTPYTPSMEVITEVAESLGLEIVHGRGRRLAYVIRQSGGKPPFLERFAGKPKWPELRLAGKGCEKARFPNGGIYWREDNKDRNDGTYYFDGVSLGELAKFFETLHHFPYVDQTGDEMRYSFTLPLTSVHRWFPFNETTRLPELGISVSSAMVEIEGLLVRDCKPKNIGKPKP